MSESSPRFRGIVPPMVTPLLGGDELDVSGLERLVEHLIAGGVAGIFILGTTGEAPSLSYRLRRELVERSTKLIDGRVPVLVGITDTSLVESLALANYSADCGADAVVAAPPYYLPAGQPELREYLDHLAARSPLPLMLYNMPSLTKVWFDSETVAHAMGIDNVVGLKDSSGDLSYFRKIQRKATERRPDWSLLVGPEEILAETVLLGGHGGVNGGANLHPKLYVDLYHAAVAGELVKTRELSMKVLELSDALYTVGHHGSSIIKGLKCALSLSGICDDFMADPFHRFRETEREVVAGRLRALGLLEA